MRIHEASRGYGILYQIFHTPWRASSCSAVISESSSKSRSNEPCRRHFQVCGHLYHDPQGMQNVLTTRLIGLACICTERNLEGLLDQVHLSVPKSSTSIRISLSVKLVRAGILDGLGLPPAVMEMN